ncbi:MAG: hypothetical protein WBD25_11110 [Terriglobales bacterium]|jgi:hypothetical protein
MTINRPTVLILASDPAFSREITANWPHDPLPHSNGPEFIILDEGFSRELQGSHYDLAIADAAFVDKQLDKQEEKKEDGKKNEKRKDKHQRLNKRLNKDLKQSLLAAGKPAILIHSDPSLDFYNIHATVIELRREPVIWPAIAGLVGREILRRVRAESRALQAEKVCATAQAEATLGRYMVEMRTNVNNALTTVLGNAELLVIEPGLPANVLAQVDTIRNMALRMHEVFQRLYSIEKELTVDARESGKKAMSATAGAR